MEYFSLGDLGHWINAPFPEAEAQDISRQILEGLEILHRDKIAHRDLKPQNIFVVEKPPSSPKWWVKIGDFGISKRLGEETTSFGTEVGTANYMAPELLDGETCKFTNAVDMWAFGCVLYLLLAWRMPFPDLKNRKKFAGAGIDVPIQPLLDRFLSSMVIDFVTNLLAVNPDHRPSAQNALESPWMTTEVHLNPEASLSDPPAMRGTPPPSARDKSSTPELVGGSAFAEDFKNIAVNQDSTAERLIVGLVLRTIFSCPKSPPTDYEQFVGLRHYIQQRRLCFHHQTGPDLHDQQMAGCHGPHDSKSTYTHQIR
jgi:serine/threonine protein kinase